MKIKKIKGQWIFFIILPQLFQEDSAGITAVGCLDSQGI